MATKNPRGKTAPKAPTKTTTPAKPTKSAAARVTPAKKSATAARPSRKAALKRATKGGPPAAPVSPPTRPESGRDSKQARLIAALRAAPGATIDQMMTLTGWQPHTVRGTISGVLRKKLGLNVTCEGPSKSGERCYRIVAAPAAA
jgi:hypothetical protein